MNTDARPTKSGCDPKNELPEKYSTPEESGLSATVSADGENVFNFDSIGVVFPLSLASDMQKQLSASVNENRPAFDMFFSSPFFMKRIAYLS